jgi:hypothetical protein
VRHRGGAGELLGRIAVASCLLAGPAAADERAPSELVGTWRGTSTCTDRIAAPACRDEVVVYEFTSGEKSGTVHWKADKVVDGQRQTMGELDLAFDSGKRCWSAEFRSPRAHRVWCLTVEGARLTGTGRMLPGGETVRRIEAQRK